MMFERLWILVFLLLPLGWTAWEWRRSKQRSGLLIKALMLALVIVALAGPVISTWDSRAAVAVLVDTSASTSASDLSTASALANRIERARGRNLVQVMPFAAGTRAPEPSEYDGARWQLNATPGAPGRSTDIEAAVVDAVSALPAGAVSRIVLISDGKENRGSAARAAWQARELGIPIDTYALDGRPRPRLSLDSVSFPGLVFAGEQFSIDIQAASPAAVDGVVRVHAEGRELGTTPVHLAQGVNRVTVRASLNSEGAFDVAGELDAAAMGTVRFGQAVSVRRPRLLYVSQDPAGTGQHLVGALEAGEFEVRQTDAIPGRGLDEYQVIVLNNWNLEAVPASAKEALEEFVQRGGGLLVIGGENNLYVDDRGRPEDPLERTLPAKLVPPRSPEGTCVILIMDKSSSMEGRKMELARLSAIGVVDNLRPEDRVGVLIFDNSFQWAVPIRKAENQSLIKRLVSGITADGGTQIAPALEEAYRRSLPVKATYKHMVLLTDGISEEGDSIALAQQANNNHVTISTVGLGQDVNKTYLEKVAKLAGGRSYFLTDPSGLARILLRDVMEHTGKTAVEEEVQPEVLKKAEVLAHLDDAPLPPLEGYVRYESKPGAETILQVGNTDEKSPLLVRWQYGLGRAAVFSSDAKSRWAAAWVGWKGFDTFWINVLRDLLPRTTAGDTTLTHDSADNELIVDYRLPRFLQEPATIPEIFVLGPNGFRQPLPVQRVAAGAFRGEVRIGEDRGFYRVIATGDGRLFPEAGLYLVEKELEDYGANPDLLRRLSAFTGGRFSPDPADVFDTGGQAVQTHLALWRWLLLLAVVLNVAEVAVRKWRRIGAARAARRG